MNCVFIVKHDVYCYEDGTYESLVEVLCDEDSARNYFEVKNGGDKNPYFILVEFPYPSGSGLHLGHCRSYTAIDAFARKERLCGKNVLFPFGTDAFGLEAERTAIREHKLPQEIVERNIATFHSQIKGLGISFDWNRTINSCDEDYYKWTQWQFIQFFKKGLAEKQETTVNYCPNCGAEMNYCTVSSDYVHTAIPNKFWILFDVPGFYDIKEYEVDKVVYEKGVLDRLWGHNDKNRVVAFAADFDKIVFFSEEKAKAKLSAILQHR